MCQNCWKASGSHSEVPENWKELFDEKESINPFGAFHIVVEDDNLEDEHIKFCMGYEGALPHEIEWGEKMLKLTFAQRWGMVAKGEGWIE